MGDMQLDCKSYSSVIVTKPTLKQFIERKVYLDNGSRGRRLHSGGVEALQQATGIEKETGSWELTY